jgi:hypothetical protein
VSINNSTSGGFGNVFDLSTLKQPINKAELPQIGLAVTQENLVSDFVAASKEKVVVLLAISARSTQSSNRNHRRATIATI